MRGDFWVITSYFNPARYRRRAENFRRFRDQLNAPLIVAEMSTSGTFEVPADNRTIVVRLKHFDVMWQKEALLNVALDNLPASAKNVAWLDCDVLFERSDWQNLARARLVQSPLAQLFTDLHDLPPSGALDLAPPRTGVSIAALQNSGKEPETAFRPSEAIHIRRSAFGLAWAGHVELMRKHRFYDAMIIGSGDRALACAALGRHIDAVASLKLSPARAAHYGAWAGPFHRAVQANVAVLPGCLFHLWHGEIADRSYVERHSRLAELTFDPAEDLIRDANGLWNWHSRRTDLAAMIEAYFASRYEDGRQAL